MYKRFTHTLRTIFIVIILVIKADLHAQQLSEALKANVTKRVEAGEFPGVVIALITADGTEYFSYGNLVAGGDEEVDEHTLFEIGSISKTFTAILLADQIEKGQMSLDDPISKYLPDTLNVPDRKGKLVRLRHLVTHTSGLSRMPSNFYPANPLNPYADYSYEQMYEFLHGYVLRRDPGRGFLYSNYGMGLLGHLLERQTGMTYEELMIEKIARPLGMNNTMITLSEDDKKRMAAAHRNGVQVSLWDIVTLAGAGGIRSSASDMVKYVKANLGLTKSSLQTAMNASHQTVITTTRDERAMAMAWIYMDNNPDILWHNGGTGGFRTFTGFNKLTGTGVVVLSNSTAGVDDIGFHLLDNSKPLK